MTAVDIVVSLIGLAIGFGALGYAISLPKSSTKPSGGKVTTHGPFGRAWIGFTQDRREHDSERAEPDGREAT